MALFKFRRGADEPAQPPPAESIEAVRRRAMHRLIGSAALVLAAVIGFPLLFDNQPRPIAVDIPIEIPDKNKGRVTSSPVANGAVVAPLVAPAPTPAAPPVEAAKEAPVVAKTEAKVPDKVAEMVEPRTSVTAPKEEILTPSKKQPDPVKPPAPVAVKPSISTPNSGNGASDGAKAQALLEGKTGDKVDKVDKVASAVEGRFVVQVGAFSDQTRAKEARTKLERAGLKTYTQVVETKDGPRTRVRVGPFGAKAEADSAAQKIKTLDLPATVLVL